MPFDQNTGSRPDSPAAGDGTSTDPEPAGTRARAGKAAKATKAVKAVEATKAAKAAKATKATGAAKITKATTTGDGTPATPRSGKPATRVPRKAAKATRTDTDRPSNAGPSGAVAPAAAAEAAPAPQPQTAAGAAVTPRAAMVAPSAATEPRGSTVDLSTGSAAEPAKEEPGSYPGEVWQRVRERPQDVPELLAASIVQRIGPSARDYTAWLRATYPGVPDDALARHMVSRFGRGRYVGPTGLTSGPATIAADLVRLGVAQARLALHVAAAYGLDPTDPDRAAELLTLAGVHPDVPTARKALAEATGPAPPPVDEPAAPAIARRVGRLVAAPAGLRLMVRAVGRALPGATTLLTMLVNRASMDDFAVRVVARYRPRREHAGTAGAGTAPAVAGQPVDDRHAGAG